MYVTGRNMLCSLGFGLLIILTMLISHRVTAEVKHNQTGNIVCEAQGEWNGMLEFSYNNRENKVIDTSKLPVTKKKIRPVEKQGQYESQ